MITDSTRAPGDRNEARYLEALESEHERVLTLLNALRKGPQPDPTSSTCRCNRRAPRGVLRRGDLHVSVPGDTPRCRSHGQPMTDHLHENCYPAASGGTDAVVERVQGYVKGAYVSAGLQAGVATLIAERKADKAKIAELMETNDCGHTCAEYSAMTLRCGRLGARIRELEEAINNYLMAEANDDNAIALLDGSTERFEMQQATRSTADMALASLRSSVEKDKAQ